jgi:hypothetical protein
MARKLVKNGKEQRIFRSRLAADIGVECRSRCKRTVEQITPQLCIVLAARSVEERLRMSRRVKGHNADYAALDHGALRTLGRRRVNLRAVRNSLDGRFEKHHDRLRSHNPADAFYCT